VKVVTVEQPGNGLSTWEGEDSLRMQEEIGAAAGTIWQILNDRGELTLPNLKEAVQVKAPVFEWATGWLAREDKIAITRKKRSFFVRLK
jgi:hypothetical protein